MSDISRVARDTKHGVRSMSEVAVRKAYGLLDALTKAHHRGRHDTWTAARDRAAKTAGIEPSYAKRIWDRWQTMTDVSGGALVALEIAYLKACERSEANEAAQIAEGERIARETAHEITVAAALERVAEHARKTAPVSASPSAPSFFRTR